MRTTLTLDEDNAAQLERLRRKEGRPFKEVVNRVLREGLRALTTPANPTAKYQLPILDLGRCLVDDLDDVSEILERVEGSGLPEDSR